MCHRFSTQNFFRSLHLAFYGGRIENHTIMHHQTAENCVN